MKTGQQTRYALERDGRQFCPIINGVPGFESATAAMLHALSMMPEEAHLWSWVPISTTDESTN